MKSSTYEQFRMSGKRHTIIRGGSFNHWKLVNAAVLSDYFWKIIQKDVGRYPKRSWNILRKSEICEKKYT